METVWSPEATITVGSVLAGVITLLILIVRMIGRRADPELLKLNGRLIDQMGKADARTEELTAAIRLNIEVNNKIISELKAHEAQTKVYLSGVRTKVDEQGVATVRVLQALVKQITILSKQHETGITAITESVAKTTSALGEVVKVVEIQNNAHKNELARISEALERIESMLIKMKPVLESLNVRMVKAEGEVATVKHSIEQLSRETPPSHPPSSSPPAITKTQAKRKAGDTEQLSEGKTGES